MDKRVAILGAGQLAKYLVVAAKKLSIPVTVVAQSLNEPACFESVPVVAGTWTAELMLKVFQDHDVVTFENEWISDSLLSQVVAAGLIHKMAPSHASMKKVRTKWDQKKFFMEQKYPTAKAILGSESDFFQLDHVKDLFAQFPKGVVLKESELAYDGKGVFVFLLEDQEKCLVKAQEMIQKKTSWYIEQRIPFQKELALVFTRGPQGQFVHYPLVEFFSENGICSMVFVESSPSLEMQRLENQAVAMARDLSSKLNWRGTAAIEFFLSEQGELLINEFAPRVHNSGHFSLSASQTSQFENHMRAIVGLDLGRCDTSPFAVMKNLIGAPNSTVSKEPSKESGVDIFWYQKSEIRAGRKMGHVNAHGKFSHKQEMIDKVNQLVEKWKLSTILKA